MSRTETPALASASQPKPRTAADDASPPYVLPLHLGLLLSGAAALLYQSCWTRMLHRVFGVGDLAVATVLATFFLGLGLGSAGAGRIAARVRRPARAYAILEIAVGVYALLSVGLVPLVGAAYGGLGPDASFAAITTVRFFLAALLLLPPTLLMGATLPVLARLREGQGWSRQITALYVSNTLGAVIGAAAAGFFIIPTMGTRAAIFGAAVLSFSAAAVVGAAYRSRVLAPEQDASVPPAPKPLDEEALEAAAASEAQAQELAERAERRRTAAARAQVEAREDDARAVRVATWLTAMTGASALASEVLWTRVLRSIVHATTTAFAAMLVNYLLGIALGALIARALAKRGNPARWLGLAQAGVVLFTGIAIAVAPQLPRIVPLLRGDADIVPHETWVILVVSAILLFPLALLVGTGLPLTWAIAERGSSAGAGSGKLLAANTLGGLVGALGAGFFMVPWMGVEASIIAVAGLTSVCAGIALRYSAGDELLPRVLGATGPFALLVAIILVDPGLDIPFLLGASQSPTRAVIEGPGEAWREDVVFLREGRNTTVTVVRNPGGLLLFNDGRPESGYSLREPGFGAELGLLAGLPVLFAEQTERALLIGLGAGHTATIALAGGFEEVEVVELEEAVVDAARFMHEARGRPFPLDDPRAQLIVDDARNRLTLLPPASLDAVVSQPSHPWLAGSSALYTREFFEEVRVVLREGGVFGLWVNVFRMDLPSLRSVVATLAAVFPHIHGFVMEESSLILLASETPLDWGSRASERLARIDSGRSIMGAFGLRTIADVAAAIELDEAAIQVFAADAEIIVDDRPTLEFALAALPNGRFVQIGEIDRAVEDQPWLSAEGLEGQGEVAWALARISRVRGRRRALARLRPSLPLLAQEGAEASFLRGRLAEAEGDVGAALRAFDEAGPRGFAAADQLRLAEGQLTRALALARTRREPPSDATPLLIAALGAGDRASAGWAADLAERTPVEESAEGVALARDYGERGCAGAISDAERALGIARQTYFVADELTRCAYTLGEDSLARQLSAAGWRARTVAANQEMNVGQAAFVGGNGGAAWLHLRRALRIYPTHSQAAVLLAQLHQRDGRRDEAVAVLRTAWDASEGLDASRGRLVAAGAALGVDLGVAPDDAHPLPSAGPLHRGDTRPDE